MAQKTKSLIWATCKLLGVTLLAIASLAVLVFASILLNHLLVKPVHQILTPYVGDLYKEKYTIIEVIDEKATMVVDSTNHILYDVMHDSSGDAYLAIHLDEYGVPMRCTMAIASERPQVQPFGFLSNFDLMVELEDSDIVLALALLAILVMLVVYVVLRCHEALEDACDDNSCTPEKS